MRGLQERVDAIPYWYHHIELPGGIVTPGWAPVDPVAYRIPEDLTGKRVLDIGAWDGYWTFEALKRGAREVVAIDDFSDVVNTEGGKERKAWDTFDLCRDALGYGEDRCTREEMSVYNAWKFGEFDIVFFFGTLYHLRHPLLALEMLSSICKEALYIETAVCDYFSPYRGGLGKGYGDDMVMEFYPANEYGNNVTNWWAPTLKALSYMVHSCGWKGVKSWRFNHDPASVTLCRGICVATRGGE